MRRWWVCLALLGGCLPGGSAVAADPPPDDAALKVVEACRARLDARNDVGLARIEKRCPELMRALETAPWGNLLPKDMRERRDEISAEGLRELAALVRGANRDVAAREAPEVAGLGPVLAELGEKGQQGATRWERFKRWLQDKLERHDQDDKGESWLKDLGRQFETSEGVARVISYSGYGLVALLVLFVVWHELRAAGLIGPGRRAEAAAQAAEWRRRLQLTDVLAAPLAERPGLLLRLLGDLLTRAHRLPSAAGLTAGALVREARLDDDTERAELQAVASTAEAVRYAPHQPGDSELEGAVSSARSLLDKLTRAGAPRTER
ncbi:MAG TPA: hypothetical protein VM146_09045 [Steroidobacteraceae bacterium]|nr:hypothetical protein [Steroidobacteraceae bacterium]